MSRIVINMKGHGAITIELFENIAPKATKHVLDFVQNKKYDGRSIERLEPNFVIQPCFCDEGDFAGLIEPEFITIEENHRYQFKRGTVAMAGIENEASDSQFFITLNPRDYLNGHFTVIGEVIDGFDEMERLEKVNVIELIEPQSGFTYHKPEIDEVIESIVIE